MKAFTTQGKLAYGTVKLGWAVGGRGGGSQASGEQAPSLTRIEWLLIFFAKNLTVTILSIRTYPFAQNAGVKSRWVDNEQF